MTELNNFFKFSSIYFSSPSTIRMIESRRMKWAGHVARMWEERMHMGYWWEIQKERDHWEYQNVGGWTISKWVLEKQGEVTENSGPRHGSSG
jgi:hypothetical protein